MYIDGDTHYWPLRFIDKVKHPIADVSLTRGENGGVIYAVLTV